MTEQTSETTAVTDPATIVQDFLTALQEEDFATVEAALADDVLWQNVGFPSIRGRDRIVKIFRRGEGRNSFEVKCHRVASEGNTVLTERTDALILGPLRIQFWVCGVFEVHDGRITLWRDYFDMFDFTKSTLRAMAAVVFPSLRPTI